MTRPISPNAGYPSPTGEPFEQAGAAPAVKDSLTAQAAPAAVPVGWRLVQISDGDIRVYGPDCESWLIREDVGEGFYDFVWRFFAAMLAAARASLAQPASVPALDKQAAFEAWLENYPIQVVGDDYELCSDAFDAGVLAAAPQPAQAAEDRAAHDNAILERGIQIGMQRQREIAAAPQPEAQPNCPRLDWCIRTLRDMADGGRPKLGDAYPTVLQVIDALRVIHGAAPSAQAEPSSKNWHAHHVTVNKGALQMIRNALRTDAEAGKQSRAEMLEELDKATFSLPSPSAQAEQKGGAA